MRCIETMVQLYCTDEVQKINYNMRCIETAVLSSKFPSQEDKLQHEMY